MFNRHRLFRKFCVQKSIMSMCKFYLNLIYKILSFIFCLFWIKPTGFFYESYTTSTSFEISCTPIRVYGESCTDFSQCYGSLVCNLDAAPGQTRNCFQSYINITFYRDFFDCNEIWVENNHFILATFFKIWIRLIYFTLNDFNVSHKS